MITTEMLNASHHTGGERRKRKFKPHPCQCGELVKPRYKAEYDITRPEGLGFFKKLFKKKPGGTKVGNFLRKHVNLKTAIKVAGTAVGFLPGGKIIDVISKVSKMGKIGKGLGDTAKAVLESDAGRQVIEKIKANAPLTTTDEAVVNSAAIANDTDPSTPNVMSKAEFSKLAPSSMQVEAPEVKLLPSEEMAIEKTVLETPPPVVPAVMPAPAMMPSMMPDSKEMLPVATKSNTMLYVAGGLAIAGAIYFATKNNK